jgi:hypothetical protein
MGSIFNLPSEFSLKYVGLNDLYLSDTNSQDSNYYGIRRQHNFNSSKSLTNNFSSNLDNKSLLKLTSYNFNLNVPKVEDAGVLRTAESGTENQLLVNSFTGSDHSNLKNTVDGIKLPNVFLYKNTKIQNSSNRDLVYGGEDSKYIPTFNESSEDSYKLINSNLVYKSLFTSSPNQNLLSGERNVRSIELINPTKGNINIGNTATSDLSNVDSTLISSSSINGCVESMARMVSKMGTVFPISHAPTNFSSSSSTSLGFDRSNLDNTTPSILSSKEELSPNYMFNSY